jgi:hypothetical protein
MNVNLWGPQLWNLLHSLAYLTNEKTANAMGGILDDLRILLPCSHCKLSYNEYYPKFKAMRANIANDAARMVFELHNMVDDKLEKQRLEKFMDDIHAKDKDIMRQQFRTLSGRPSFDVVLKRGALAEGLIETSCVWRVLFAFSLAIENDPLKPVALGRFIDNVNTFIPSMNLPKSVSHSEYTAFAIVWLSRSGQETFRWNLDKNMNKYAQHIAQSYAMYKEQLTAGSCRSK